ncbi:hypothetical protein [Ancylobacter lacus]|uniref:hypothetical protein n=1 Tax=Ancylobacter lacus TaxID=2579970 RepID=UPI001BCEB722|nr:hypothetical protein [Ancylobacter lacus]MBS7537950.1 hypothetical protein [Ancylobacter lacus]
MIFSPADAVLFVSLVVTSACVIIMYLKLDTLTACQRDYRVALRESADALSSAHQAVSLLNRDSQELLLALCDRIEAAEHIIGEMDQRFGASRPPRPRTNLEFEP